MREESKNIPTAAAANFQTLPPQQQQQILQQHQQQQQQMAAQGPMPNTPGRHSMTMNVGFSFPAF
jgi:hypothetical protein